MNTTEVLNHVPCVLRCTVQAVTIFYLCILPFLDVHLSKLIIIILLSYSTAGCRLTMNTLHHKYFYMCLIICFVLAFFLHTEFSICVLLPRNQLLFTWSHSLNFRYKKKKKKSLKCLLLFYCYLHNWYHHNHHYQSNVNNNNNHNRNQALFPNIHQGMR